MDVTWIEPVQALKDPRWWLEPCLSENDPARCDCTLIWRPRPPTNMRVNLLTSRIVAERGEVVLTAGRGSDSSWWTDSVPCFPKRVALMRCHLLLLILMSGYSSLAWPEPASHKNPTLPRCISTAMKSTWYTAPVKRWDKPNHSKVFLYLYYFLHCRIIAKISKLWNNTYGSCSNQKVLLYTCSYSSNIDIHYKGFMKGSL